MAEELILVLFDCDGTLVDSQHSIAAAMAVAFEGCGLTPPPLAAVRQVVGLSLSESVQRLAPSLPEARVAAVVAAYRQAFAHLYADDPARDPLYPGAREAISALDDAGRLMGIATGKSRGGVSVLLDGHELLHRFVTLQTPDTNPGKPHPGMIDSALAETGVERTHTLFVGDSVYDMQMAVNAGVVGIGVDWGYHAPAELKQAGAAHVLSRFDDLADLVHKFAAERR